MSDISDHYSQVCFLSSNLKRIFKGKIRKRDLSSFNQTDFNNDLELITWPPNSDTDCATKTYLNKILLIQKRALRLIYFTDYKQHAVPFVLNSKVFPLSFIYFDCLCSIMWYVANNSSPENIKRAFTRIAEVHSDPTRSSLNDDFYTEHSRLEKMRSSFLRVGPKIWNSLPSDMRNLPKSTFRKKTRNKLFEILSKSDDYLEITEIMHQLKFN